MTEDFAAAVAETGRAAGAFVGGAPEPYVSRWAHGPHVTIFGGGVTTSTDGTRWARALTGQRSCSSGVGPSSTSSRWPAAGTWGTACRWSAGTPT
jgi:hypothetical protein